jgi:hypothetical protein
LPTLESSRPVATISSALICEPEESCVTSSRPSSTSAVYSAGPNASATLASAGPTRNSAIVTSTPAMNEPNAAMPSAAPARPCRAMA